MYSCSTCTASCGCPVRWSRRASALGTSAWSGRAARTCGAAGRGETAAEGGRGRGGALCVGLTRLLHGAARKPSNLPFCRSSSGGTATKLPTCVHVRALGSVRQAASPPAAAPRSPCGCPPSRHTAWPDRTAHPGPPCPAAAPGQGGGGRRRRLAASLHHEPLPRGTWAGTARRW
jgi:hypothetical protein